MSKEKRVVFFEGKSWYHRIKELQDDLTTKYGKKGGFETPEEAEKSYWEYEKIIWNIGLKIFSVRELRQPRGWLEHIRYII